MIIIKAKKKETDKKLEDVIELLSKIKKALKDNDIAKEICNEFNYKTDIIDGVPIEFSKDIDVSAKTIDSHIKLNYNLIDEDFSTVMRYAIHELVHALQHMSSKESGSNDDVKDYLDRSDELEAFQYQIKFQEEEISPNDASEYVEDLLEYHEIPSDSKKEKREELLEKTE